METLTFAAIFFVTVKIFFQAAIGFSLVKIRILNTQGVETLTKILVNFLMPIFIFQRLVTTFNFESFRFWWIFPLLAFALTALGLIISQIIICFKSKFVYKNELKSLTVFSNCGYIPLVLINDLPAQEKSILLVYTLLYIIGFEVLLWTLGSWLLTRSKAESINFKRMASPPLLAILFSLIIIGLGWHHAIPSVIMDILKKISSMSLPMAIIVVGGHLAETSFKKIYFKETLWVSLSKLVLMPIACLIILKLFTFDRMAGVFIMIQALMPSAVSLAVLSQYFDAEHKDFVNQSIFMTHLFCIVTVPVFMALYLKLI